MEGLEPWLTTRLEAANSFVSTVETVATRGWGYHKLDNESHQIHAQFAVRAGDQEPRSLHQKTVGPRTVTTWISVRLGQQFWVVI